MAIHKNLKKRLSEEQIEAYMKWEERWKGKRWYGEDGNRRLDELLEIVLPGYKRKGEVIGRFKKVLIECGKGHGWEVVPTNIILGMQCPTCSQRKQIRDVWDVYYSVLEKTEYEMDVKTYISMHKQAKFKCKNGNWFCGKPAFVERGSKKCQCKACKKERGKRKYRTKEEYIEELKKRGFILYPKDWKGAKSKTRMWCVEGQHWTYQRPDNILNINIGCAVCSGSVKHNLDKLQEELFGPAGYTVKEGAVYKNVDTPISLICPKGHDCEISVSGFRNGHLCRQCFYDDMSERMSGENNPNYDHNKTEEERKELEEVRQDSRYRKAKELSKQRDGKVCVICGMTEKEAEAKGLNHVQKVLNGHHLFSFTTIEKARYVLDNWITLCYWCHQDDFHAKYGRDGTTNGFQFLEWIESKDVPDELKETIRERVEMVSGFIESDFDNYDDYLNHIGKSKKGTA